MKGEPTVIEEMDSIIAKTLEHKPRSKSPREIIEMAIAVERLMKDYYLDMAGRVGNRTGNTMFKYLAIEEAGHLKELMVQEHALKHDRKWLMREKIAPMASICPVVMPEKRDIRTIKDIVPDKPLRRKDMPDLEILKLAIEAKKRAIRFYCEAASKVGDAYGKKMFAHLIEMENKHLNELMVQYAWLDQAGFWYDTRMMTD
jgi:rubrerythrin